MVKIRDTIVIVFLMLASAAIGQNLVLDCDTSETKMNKAPSGARRIDEHTLEVKFSNGSKSFHNEPPFDYELDGVEYEYCDYNPTVKFHLIRKRDQDVFTGVLMSETNGKTLDAGQLVIFSPDGKKYFAARQPNGMDGNQWFIFTVAGELEWKGDSMADTLVEPGWNSEGKFQAKYRCSNEDYKTVVLTKSRKEWSWVPEAKCP
jgi:hypothetical protein